MTDGGRVPARPNMLSGKELSTAASDSVISARTPPGVFVGRSPVWIISVARVSVPRVLKNSVGGEVLEVDVVVNSDAASKVGGTRVSCCPMAGDEKGEIDSTSLWPQVGFLSSALSSTLSSDAKIKDAA